MILQSSMPVFHSRMLFSYFFVKKFSLALHCELCNCLLFSKLYCQPRCLEFEFLPVEKDALKFQLQVPFSKPCYKMSTSTAHGGRELGENWLNRERTGHGSKCQCREFEVTSTSWLCQPSSFCWIKGLVVGIGLTE